MSCDKCKANPHDTNGDQCVCHVCTPVSCPPGNYFVTCIDGPKMWHMAGPYSSHIEALSKVDAAREIGIANTSWATFYLWGTVRSDRTAPGSITKAGLM